METIVALLLLFATLFGWQQPYSPVQRETITDGTWMVPEEVKPGTYRTVSDGRCYWERLRNFGSNREEDSIIDNDAATSEGPVIVTIKKSDAAFKTERCGTWQRIERKKK